MRLSVALSLVCAAAASVTPPLTSGHSDQSPRKSIKLSTGWRFWRSETIPDNITYDLRSDANDTGLTIMKPWILPCANTFIQNSEDHFTRPPEEPEVDAPYMTPEFDDSDWEEVTVPHDWAIAGPFYTDEEPVIGHDMGLLPSQGVGWYRRTLTFTNDDVEKKTYLDVDGAMSYPMVWLNGHFVGGWAYGYNSFQLDLSPHIQVGGDNVLAIRVENPAGESSRWYTGGGLYRNVWLTQTNEVHVAHWGTFVSSKNVSAEQATIYLAVDVENTRESRNAVVQVETSIVSPEDDTPLATFAEDVEVVPGHKVTVQGSVTLQHPQLWGPPPIGAPNLYAAVTKIYDGTELLDSYKTRFGLRNIQYDGDQGITVNGQKIRIQGVNQHHDLGALGAAFNFRAAQRQLERLHEVGANAIRTAHNPAAPELLDLADEMGFLVLNEIYDSWEIKKTENDFHLIFPDWREADLRAFMRRDRNHPSVFAWSYGNEVAEQQVADTRGAELSRYLRNIVEDEDLTRPNTISLHFSKPNSSLAQTVDMINLNYQGEGMRYGPAYAHLTTGNRSPPQYANFHEAFPDKTIIGSEVAWSLSSRGSFLLPVTPYNSAPVNDTFGGDSETKEISAYELYSSDSGSSPDRVFLTQDQYPFVAGGFVWAGWDYLGEPYPYKSRSAYSGIFDLAGFKKTRFYQYQARWRPDFPMAHILPHWTWPEDK